MRGSLNFRHICSFILWVDYSTSNSTFPEQMIHLHPIFHPGTQTKAFLFLLAYETSLCPLDNEISILSILL